MNIDYFVKSDDVKEICYELVFDAVENLRLSVVEAVNTHPVITVESYLFNKFGRYNAIKIEELEDYSKVDIIAENASYSFFFLDDEIVDSYLGKFPMRKRTIELEKVGFLLENLDAKNWKELTEVDEDPGKIIRIEINFVSSPLSITSPLCSVKKRLIQEKSESPKINEGRFKNKLVKSYFEELNLK